MISFAWVLVLTINGTQVKSEPTIGEACIIRMLDKPASQYPYCLNIETNQRMNRPKDCKEDYPRWCRQ